MMNKMKTIMISLITLMFLGSGVGYAGDYLNSAHGSSTDGVSSRLSYGKGNCAHCHEQHASIGGTEPVPNSPAGPDEYLLFQDYQDDSYNAFCTTVCHKALGLGGDDIAAQYAKTYHHPTTGDHTPGENTSGAFAAGTTRHGYCIDCHNPHVAQATLHEAGTNAASGPLLKVSGVTAGGSFTSEISFEYELCYKCHSSSWTTQPDTAQADIDAEFDPANASYHPVEANLATGTGKGSTPLADAQVGNGVDEWENEGAQTMYCSDCHGDDASSPPAGPHGSGIPKILKGRWPEKSLGVLYTLADGSLDDNCLCKNCHPLNIDNGPNYVHNYYRHQSTAKSGQICDCVQCHVGLPHGYHYTTGGATMEGRLIAHADDVAPYNYGGNTATITRFEQNASAPGTYAQSDCAATCTTRH